MKVFFHIITNSILPIFILIFLGYYVSKKKDFDIQTLSKINVNIYLPIFIFVNLYTTTIPYEMFKVFIYSILFLLFNEILTNIVIKLKKYDSNMASAIKNSVMFYNVGNIGIPIVMLVFSSSPFIKNGQRPYLDIALATQFVIYITQNISMYSIGFFNANRGKLHWKDSVKRILSMPSIHAIPLAFIMKQIPYDLTEIPIWSSLSQVKEGFVSLILITLGIQLSKTQLNLKDKNVYFTTILRLIVGPLLTLFLIYIMGFEGVIAQTILISSAAPTAVNIALIAIDSDTCPDFVSQVVTTSTLLSGIILAFIIFIARILFPVAI